MKKAVYFTLGLILLSVLTNAGNTGSLTSSPAPDNHLTFKPTNGGGKKCFDESSRVINVGIGFGYSYHGKASGAGVTSVQLPAFSVSYEQPWSKRFGPGLMGVGGYLAFKSSAWKEEYAYAGGSYVYKDNYNDVIVASRAMYHWDGLNSEKAEVYGGVVLGIRISANSYSNEYTGIYATPSNPNTSGSDVSIGIAYAMVAGARYYVTPKIAVYSELSYGISFLTFGATFKL